jgi:hypothetical protein
MTFIPDLAKREPSSAAALTYSLSIRLLEEAKTHTVISQKKNCVTRLVIITRCPPEGGSNLG